jgi:hypothetical protein
MAALGESHSEEDFDKTNQPPPPLQRIDYEVLSESVSIRARHYVLRSRPARNAA